MTDDRIFKNKVKEVAELNGLTYTEAKKAVIELNKRIEEASKDHDANILKYMDSKSIEDAAKNSYIFPIDGSLFVEPMEEHYFKVKRGKPSNPKEGETDFFELTTKNPIRWLDFLPLNNKVRNVVYTNVIRSNRMYGEKETVRKVYFSLVKHFTPENSYFIEGPGSIIRLKKVVQALKTHKETDHILVGLISHYSDSETSKNFYNLRQELTDLAETRNICIVSNLLFDKDDKRINLDVDDEKCIKLDMDDVEIEYYPFDKLHGGSYHRSTNKMILGHLKGEAQFIKSDLMLIERNDTSCLKSVYRINDSEADFVQIKSADEMIDFFKKNHSRVVEDYAIRSSMSYRNNEHFVHLGNNTFLKIDFEMDSEMLKVFCDSIRFNHHTLTHGSIVIESPDAEAMSSHYKDTESLKEELNVEYLALIDGKLHNETGDEISLYKV